MPSSGVLRLYWGQWTGSRQGNDRVSGLALGRPPGLPRAQGGQCIKSMGRGKGGRYVGDMKGRWERTIGQMMPKVMYERAQEMALDLPARGPAVTATSRVPGEWALEGGN